MEFGNDAGEWANDGECDDPRFRGVGMAAIVSAAHEGRDATDCRALLDAGQIEVAFGGRMEASRSTADADGASSTHLSRLPAPTQPAPTGMAAAGV